MDIGSNIKSELYWLQSSIYALCILLELCNFENLASSTCN